MSGGDRRMRRCAIGAESCQGAAVHVHHRKLRSQGGGDEPDNLIEVCASCHLAIHADPERAYAAGWLVRSWDDPASVARSPLSP